MTVHREPMYIEGSAFFLKIEAHNGDVVERWGTGDSDFAVRRALDPGRYSIVTMQLGCGGDGSNCEAPGERCRSGFAIKAEHTTRRKLVYGYKISPCPQRVEMSPTDAQGMGRFVMTVHRELMFIEGSKFRMTIRTDDGELVERWDSPDLDFAVGRTLDVGSYSITTQQHSFCPCPSDIWGPPSNQCQSTFTVYADETLRFRLVYAYDVDQCPVRVEVVARG